MSRIGKVPIQVPSDVTVVMGQDQWLQVEGKKGILKRKIDLPVEIKIEPNVIVISPNDQSQVARSSWGLVRTLVHNMIVGVSVGYEKTLELHGTGYNVAVQGVYVKMFLGHSHDIFYLLPEGVTVESATPRTITVKGCDKEKVGQVAADLRALRRPEPYKGKGVRYLGEKVRTKISKSKK